MGRTIGRIETWRKRIISIILSCSIIIGSLLSCLVVKADITDAAGVGYGFVFAKYMITQTFGLFTSDLDTFIANDERYQEYIDNFNAKYGDNPSPDVDKEDVENLFNITKDAMQALNGYYLIEPNFDKDALYSLVSKTIPDSHVDVFNQIYQSLSNQFLVFTSGGGSCYFADCSSNFYIGSDGNVGVYPLINNNQYPLVLSEVILKSGSYFSCNIYSSGINYILSSSMSLSSTVLPVKLFYTKLDLMKYLEQMPNSVTSSNFNMPVLSGNTMNVNLGDIGQTDWSVVNKSIYDAAKEGIADGWASMNDSQRQDIIDQKMNDILGSLGEIGDNTGQSNALLSGVKDILNSINIKLSGMVTDFAEVLKNQSTLLDLFKDFSFEKLLDVIKSSGGGGGGGSLIGSTIGSVIGNLLSDLLDKIQNGDETVESVLEILVDKFSGLANVSKTKFPFSLPWDMVAVFGALAAEPQTPVFEFPIVIESIGFSYTIRMDLTDFEALSKLSRSFFVLIFSLMLIRLTLLMTVRGDFD